VPGSLTDMELGKSVIDLECEPLEKMSARQPAHYESVLHSLVLRKECEAYYLIKKLWPLTYDHSLMP
jgi:hypothetical protein